MSFIFISISSNGPQYTYPINNPPTNPIGNYNFYRYNSSFCSCGKFIIFGESAFPCLNSGHVYCTHCNIEIQKMEEVHKKYQKRYEDLKKLFPNNIK